MHNKLINELKIFNLIKNSPLQCNINHYDDINNDSKFQKQKKNRPPRTEQNV